jgi:hypothetical protein
MTRAITATIALVLLQLPSCDFMDSSKVINPSLTPVGYWELPPGQIPPCLEIGGDQATVVIGSVTDYDSVKIRYAPQGPYEDFLADGSQTIFKLSYQPLDADEDGRIGQEDLGIYLTGQPIFVQYFSKTIKVNSDPFYIIGDSILIFNDITGNVDGKIPYRLVLSVDSISGEVSFVSPPPTGDKLSICASQKLYPTYQGRDCSMNNFDFSRYSIIGLRITGNGCLEGFDKLVLKDASSRQIIYSYRRRIRQQAGGCNENLSVFKSWIEIPRIPDGYSVIFQETP